MDTPKPTDCRQKGQFDDTGQLLTYNRSAGEEAARGNFILFVHFTFYRRFSNSDFLTEVSANPKGWGPTVSIANADYNQTLGAIVVRLNPLMITFG